MTPYYEKDGITLYHGDCREVLPNLGTFDLLLTDPPYSTGRDCGEFRASGNIAVCLHLASQKVDRALVFSGSSNRSMEFVRSSIRSPQHNRILCWHNSRSRSVATGPWAWDLILIHYFGKALEHQSGLSAMIQTPGTVEKVKHRAAVPVEIMEQLYSPFAPGEVLDPFCGSGASLLAVKKHGGHGVGIEIEERYCEIAAKRLDNVEKAR